MLSISLSYFRYPPLISFGINPNNFRYLPYTFVISLTLSIFTPYTFSISLILSVFPLYFHDLIISVSLLYFLYPQFTFHTPPPPYTFDIVLLRTVSPLYFRYSQVRMIAIVIKRRGGSHRRCVLRRRRTGSTFSNHGTRSTCLRGWRHLIGWRLRLSIAQIIQSQIGQIVRLGSGL